ncbi:hypothetical protein BDW02DRAFT_481004, partial [Decorospora gaudefroyi]
QSRAEQVSEAALRAEECKEMKRWAEGFRVNRPIPKDLLPILAKGDDKQMEIFLRNMSLGR